MNGFDSQAVVDSLTQWLSTELDLEPCNGIQEGKICYCRAKGKGKPNRDGRVRAFFNHRPAAWAENHYNGSGVRTWAYGRDEDYSPAEREASRAAIEAARREREAEDVKVKEAAAALAGQTLKDDTEPCAAHSYTTIKNVQVHGLLATTRELRFPCTDGKKFLTVPRGSLVIPLSDVHGKVRNLQFIFPDRSKWFLPGGRVRGCFFLLGKLTGKPGEWVLMAEGFATGATLFEATGLPTLVTFNAGNLAPVVEEFQAAHPGVRPGLCNDDDSRKGTFTGLKAAEKALAASANGALVSPPLGPAKETGATDWNDLAQFIGLGWKEQIAMEVNAALAQATATEASTAPETITLSTVEPVKIEWQWRGRVAIGRMTVITGRPGVGKGLLLCYVASHVSTGQPMHGDSIAQPPGDVLWIATEDTADEDLVPRLIAAKADRARIHSWRMDRGLSLPSDAQRVIAEMRRRHARLLIIDPAPTLLDKDHSSNNDANVRQSFAELSAACHESKCALILVRHTNKRTLGDAMDRGGGSIGWTGMARIEMMLGRRPVEEGATVADTHDSVVTLAIVKANSGRWAPSLNLAIVEAGDSARIEVLGETQTTADDLCATDKPRTAHKTSEAEGLLRRILADGEWHRSPEIELAAKDAEISIATLKRAKKSLNVDATKRGDVWWCRLPQQSQGGMADTVDTLDTVAAREPLDSYNNNYLDSQEYQGAQESHTPPPDTLGDAEATPRRVKKVSV